MRSTIVASLLPRAYPVLLGFAGTDVTSIFLAPIRGTEPPEPDLIARAAERGLTITADAHGFAAIDDGSIADEARMRASTVFASAPYRAAVAELPVAERNRVAPHLERIAAHVFADAISLIDVLDDLATRSDVRGAIVSEDASSSTRTLVRWARARGLPSVQLTHGASPLYTLFSAQFLVDDHYLYGRHIFPSLTDMGIAPDRLHLGTFYGHEEHRSPPPDARAAFRDRFGLAGGDVVVALALGFNSFATAFEPDGFWCLNVLTAFVEAVRILRDRGVTCVPLIKHRWPDPQVQALTRDAAQRFGIDVHYFDGAMAELLPGIDVLCATDSNTLVEASFYECAILDVVYPWQWHIGPQYERDDGVPYADARYPARIAEALEPLVDDRGRHGQIALRAARSERIVADRSGDPDRIARDLLAILDRRAATLTNAAAPHAAPLDAINAVPIDARTILDATNAPETRALLRARLPGARIDTANLADHDVASAAYDLAIAGYALARAHEPAAALARIAATLAPGGRIVVQFPNARNLRYLKDRAANRPWAERRIGRDGEAMPATVSDAIGLLSAGGFTAEAVTFHADRALAMPADPAAGPSTITVGDLTIASVMPDDLREFQAAGFVIVARKTA